MTELLHIDPKVIIQTAGLIGVIAIVFAESGLFFGFFLPGDSLLFTAGILASQGFLNLPGLVIGVGIAAIAGDSVGYWFGKKVGPAIFSRDDSVFFTPAHIARTRAFYEKYGPKAIVLARFVPVVRTFTPILAGVGQMNYGLFLRYNIIGGLLWASGISFLGYWLGATFPWIEEYLTYIIIAVIVVSVLPIVYELVMFRRRGK